MLLRTLYGVLIEALLADFFTVLGLAGQKRAVMMYREEMKRKRENEIEGANALQPLGVSDIGPRPLLRHSSSMSSTESTRNLSSIPELGLLMDFRWLAALGVFLMGQVLEVVALGFASETAVVAVSNLTLFWNALVSVWFFREKFTVFPTNHEWSWRMFVGWDLFSCSLLVIGSIITVIFTPSPPDDTQMSAETLMSMWGEVPFCIFGAVLVGMSALFSIALWHYWGDPEKADFNAVAIATLCAIFSAFTVTMSKVTTTLLKKTLSGDNQYKSFDAVVMTVLWIVLLLLSLWLLNVGLGSFDQGLVVPVFEVFGTTLTIISGMLFFKTYHGVSMESWLGLVVGMCIMTVGIILLLHREHHQKRLPRHSAHHRLLPTEEYLLEQDGCDPISRETDDRFTSDGSTSGASYISIN